MVRAPGSGQFFIWRCFQQRLMGGLHMLTIYGSPYCPDCTEAIAKFDALKLPYEFVNISGSMPELKAFLKLRDTEELFAPVKEQGSVGIPCFRLSDGKLTFDVSQALIHAYVQAHGQELVNDTVRLCRIDSARGDAQPGMPFGKGPSDVLAEGTALLEEYGFTVNSCDNYAIDTWLNDKEPGLDILAHLDVVPGGDGWTVTTPFEPVVDGNTIYGRGTSDDKGPAMAALLAMRAVRDLGFALNKNVRLILGSDEECGSSDIRYYFSKNANAPMTISPDADFPVIFLEKGRLGSGFSAESPLEEGLPRVISVDGGIKSNVVPAKADAVVEGFKAEELVPFLKAAGEKTGAVFSAKYVGDRILIHAEGKSAHGSAPMDGVNAITALLSLLAELPLAESRRTKQLRAAAALFPHGDFTGKALGVDLEDEVSGKTTLALTLFHLNEKEIGGSFDARTCVSATEENTTAVVNAAFAAHGFTDNGATLKAPHYVPKDSELVKTLVETFAQVSGEVREPLAIGGGTYVHNIENGVACGCAVPEVDNHMHGPDEFVFIDRLLMSAEVFALAILKLCGDYSA